jgi:hypothetical protein
VCFGIAAVASLSQCSEGEAFFVFFKFPFLFIVVAKIMLLV